MDFDRLPRRMLSAWVPHKRPIGAPRLTYGRSMVKAMDVFDLDPSRWHEFAADRAAWRTMLREGVAPPEFRTPPPAPVPMPISHFLVRPRRAAAAATNAAIDASLAFSTIFALSHWFDRAVCRTLLTVAARRHA